MKLKKIAILTPNLYHGGAERVAGLLSMKLSSLYEVYVFIRDAAERNYEYGGELIDCGRDGADYYEYYVDYYKKILAIDCSISFMEPFNFVNIRTRQKNEKIIISERNVQSKFFPPMYYENFWAKKLYNYADAIVAVSEGVKEDLIYNFEVQPELITTIYNFINKRRVKELANKLYESDESIAFKEFVKDDPYFVNVGRLSLQKNQHKLLIQFAKVVQEKPNIKLVFIGSGELEDELNVLIKSLKMEDKVKIIARTPNPFIYMKNAVSFVLSSDFEGLPNVLLEAMTLGVPCISVDCMSGPRELMKETGNYQDKIELNQHLDRGILVPDLETDKEGSTSFLADAMKFMLENKDYRDKVSENEKLYMEQYDNEKLLDSWIQTIEDSRRTDIKKNWDISLKKVSVYGAGKVGKMVVRQLLEDGISVENIIVSDVENNPPMIDGVKVISLEEAGKNAENIDLVFGVTGPAKDEITRKIENVGFRSIHIPRIRPEE